MTIDWDELLRVYREAIEDEAIVGRVIRRWLTQHGMISSAEGLADILAELERRQEATPDTPPDDPPPEPAPIFPPPPPSAPQAEPAAPSLPELAPNARQEPPMSSVDLGVVLSRALPAAISLYQIATTDTVLEEMTDAIVGTARRAARLAKRAPLTEDARLDLRREACDELKCVLPTLTDEAMETISEIVIDAVDEATNTGPLEEIDGPLAKRGIAALIERIELWSSDPGNLEALARTDRREAARAERRAERLERIAARKRARG